MTNEFLLQTLIDDNADGTPDRIETNTYDANGNRTSKVLNSTFKTSSKKRLGAYLIKLQGQCRKL